MKVYPNRRKKNTYSKIFFTKWKTSTFAKICPGQARLPTLKGITFSCLRNSPSTIYRSGENLYASGKYFSDIWMPIKLSMGSKIVIYGWKYLKFGFICRVKKVEKNQKLAPDQDFGPKILVSFGRFCLRIIMSKFFRQVCGCIHWVKKMEFFSNSGPSDLTFGQKSIGQFCKFWLFAA